MATLLHVIIFPEASMHLIMIRPIFYFYILRPQPIKRGPQYMYTPSEIITTIRPNTFTAQEAGI